MMPIFLPHTALDAFDELAVTRLPPGERSGRRHLRQLRDKARAQGASVLLLVWPTLDWALLAVEPPPDVTITDPLQLLPNLMANPDALAEMHARSRKGEHLVWLHLARPGAAIPQTKTPQAAT